MKWTEERYKSWKAEIRKSNGGITSVDHYMGNAYQYINEEFRGIKVPSDDYFKNIGSELAEQLKSAGSLSEDIIVYRIVDDLTFEKIIRDMKLNTVFIDKGFMSTTLLRENILNGEHRYVCDNRCVLKIHAKKGVVGAYISIFDENKMNEYEMLFLNNAELKLGSSTNIFINDSRIILECFYENNHC